MNSEFAAAFGLGAAATPEIAGNLVTGCVNSKDGNGNVMANMFKMTTKNPANPQVEIVFHVGKKILDTPGFIVKQPDGSWKLGDKARTYSRDGNTIAGFGDAPTSGKLS